MISLFNLCITLLDWYSYFLTAYIIFSWLYSFGLLQNASPIIHNIAQFIYTIIEPALVQIRKLLPATSGSVDFSPFILYLLIWFIKSLIYEYGLKLIY